MFLKQFWSDPEENGGWKAAAAEQAFDWYQIWSGDGKTALFIIPCWTDINEQVTVKLYAGDPTGIPATRNSMEQLSVAEDKLAKVMTRLLGVDIFNKKLEMDEERFVPEGLGYKTDLFEEEEKVKN